MWNVVQQVQIRTLRKGQAIADRDAQWKLERHRERSEELEDDLRHLSIVCEAMWSILSERLGVTDEELLQRVMNMDEPSTVATPQPSGVHRCHSCGAVLPPRSKRCQMCSAQVTPAIPAARQPPSVPPAGGWDAPPPGGWDPGPR